MFYCAKKMAPFLMALSVLFFHPSAFSKENDHHQSLDEKNLGQTAKRLILDLKTLLPGGPLLEEERKTIEKELALFEQDLHKGKIKKPPFVRYQDVKKWKLLGDRYALGLDEKGKKLGVFDLSFPDRRSPEYREKALLALIKSPGYYLRDLISLIRKVIKAKRKEKEYHLFSNDPLDEKLSNAEKFLNLLEKHHPHKKGIFPTKGWEHVKWKNHSIVASKIPPRSFTLNDIDFEQTARPHQRWIFKKKWSKLDNLLQKYWGVSLKKDILGSLRWNQTKEGHALSFVPESISPSRPRKIVDFIRWRESFGRAIARLLIKEITIQIGSLLPGVGPVLKLSLRRWFNFEEEQMGLHRYAFLEYLNATERGNRINSFDLLSTRERTKAAVHIEAHQSNIFFKIFKLRNARWWKKEVSKEMKRNNQSEDYLIKKDYDLERISDLFTRGTRFKRGKKQEHLFLMALHPLFIKKPVSCLNYQFPYRKRAKRQLINIGKNILDLIPIQTPGVSMALNMIYDFLIKTGDDKAKIWESRLLSQLRLDNQNGKWNHEIELMYEQKLNPFELNLKEEKIFLSKMKSAHHF